jgi:quercetin dioxygenase-like cupin family protein
MNGQTMGDDANPGVVPRPAHDYPHEKRRMKATRLVAKVALIFGSALVVQAARAGQALPGGITRTELQRHDLSAEGREMVQVRVDFAPGASFPRHSHPGEEIVYCIAGELEYRLDRKPPTTLEPGRVLFIPVGTIHTVKNVGSRNAAELATYVVRKGKPLIMLAK